MAGRVPVGSHRMAVAKEMEAIFVQNLNYAADILSKVGDLFSVNRPIPPSSTISVFMSVLKLGFCRNIVGDCKKTVEYMKARTKCAHMSLGLQKTLYNSLLI